MPRTRRFRRLIGAVAFATAAVLAPMIAASPVAAQSAPPAEASPEPGPAACGPDPVCLALVAKDYENCAGFREGVSMGWYPVWATNQTGVCVETEAGEVLYGFTGPTDQGTFEFFALSARGAICRGTGHRTVLAARDRSILDGAASFACTDGRVGALTFGAGESGVAGAGAFLKGSVFRLSAFDMRGVAPSLFKPLEQALQDAAKKAAEQSKGKGI